MKGQVQEPRPHAKQGPWCDGFCNLIQQLQQDSNKKRVSGPPRSKVDSTSSTMYEFDFLLLISITIRLSIPIDFVVLSMKRRDGEGVRG